MKSTRTLPEGYKKIYSVDLQKNKKMLLAVNGLALLITVAMIVPVCFYIPMITLFDMEKGILLYILRFAVLLLGGVVYIILHEFVHGIAMKLCGTKKIKYGFTGMYAFAGSDDYYSKKPYIFIALAPVVLWGVVLLAINLLVPTEWFWVVYFIQIGNISGAAGDFFVTFKFSRMPSDILVKDYGVGMEVYSLHSTRG
ncbi:MAG: DUF3267 domain-containing protein [Ruminococcaceae bacterium]|nr:DUF3267 domain-containing protein [Oscillospiraceae bacterium]MBR5514774.1 DUF3267 domain-containing protein [Clostridia bacterium]